LDESNDLSYKVMVLEQKIRELETRVKRLEEIIDELYVLLRSYL